MEPEDDAITKEEPFMNATINATPNMRTYKRCEIRYDWRRSSSTSLKMTHCNALCENADLGFTLDAILRFELVGTH